MNIVEIKYKKTVNLGNYESAALEATAQLEEGECPDASFSSLKGFVEDSLKGKVVEPKKEVKKPKKEVEEEAEDKPAKKKTAKKTTKRKKKDVVYDRDNDAHKDEFASSLSGLCPWWKDSAETKSRAKQTSLALNGEPMFDGETGLMLGSFAEKIKESMGEEPKSDDL